jgi:hypothetical protein
MQTKGYLPPFFINHSLLLVSHFYLLFLFLPCMLSTIYPQSNSIQLKATVQGHSALRLTLFHTRMKVTDVWCVIDNADPCLLFGGGSFWFWLACFCRLSSESRNNICYSILIRYYTNTWQEVLGRTNRLLFWYDTDLIEYDESNNSFIVACVFVSVVMFLPSRCVATIEECT